MTVTQTNTAPAPAAQRPDAVTLGAFAGVVLIAGANFVAVRYSNRELAPFWGAALRFASASVLLFAISRTQRLTLPRGRALLGALLFGFLGVFGAYAFVYEGLRKVPASLGSPIMAAVPLMTFFLALGHRLEKFRWRGLAGGLVSIAGIAVLSSSGASSSHVPVGAVLLVVAAAACAAESSVIVKLFPRTHPFALNAVAMAFGSVLLFALSFATGERHALPEHARTWVALAYLIVLGSVGLFVFFVTVINRWTVTGASYQFVLFPIVSVLLAAWILDESITAAAGIGAVLVLAGVYLGALSGVRHHHHAAASSPPAGSPEPVAVAAGAADCLPPC